MNLYQKTVEYFRSAKAEMFKVSWPSRRDTMRYSGLVIGICVVVAAFFAALDYGFQTLSDSTLLVYAQRQVQTPTQTQPQTKNVQTIPITPVSSTETSSPAAQTTQPAAASNINLQNAQPIQTPKK